MFEAAFFDRCFLPEGALLVVASPGEENMKMRNPIISSPASTTVIGFVRRNDRDWGILQTSCDPKEGRQAPTISVSILWRWKEPCSELKETDSLSL